MGNMGELSPYDATDAAGFVASMRQLKERARLTYRELEERAAANGDVLARSTLADILRRTNLPRPEVLAAFVRACGDGQRLGAWLDARDRIAAGAAAVPGLVLGPDPEIGSPAGEPADARPRRTRGRAYAMGAAVTVPLLALTAWVLLPGGPGAPPAASPADGWVTIRPARTPELCLTDGRDRDGAYGSAVAVQLSCARATVPRTYLEPAGEGLYRIQWHHPEEGKGCLTVMTGGPVKGMLEERCTGAADQRFLVRAG
ncbi:helix-turn-helix domain-containing protein [Streptomyces sp. S.PNR 29]|uniref:helix-turn-helix domain-containing protein n=1 Tax=Streptomyces sp. S.PNR 29 TaxID=2973805 RepID=UPI0025AFC1AB|nr:helix-turn-helix domain-containing protein [Streptomyces sp. S.PNR 29]MDN0197314.1 XRE family transcriptional regulator [Streptomyces sp. S.PNR 29]